MDRHAKTKPRVTEIIRAVGLGKDFSQIDPFYRDRGTACHKAIELYLKGTLDLESIDDCYKGHFEGFLAWWEIAKGKGKIESELHLENEDYQGTIDLLYGGYIYDFKCSKSHDPVAEIQGAGYRKLVGNGSPFVVIQLPGDGSYKRTDYASPVKLWDAVWEIYCWKTKK